MGKITAGSIIAIGYGRLSFDDPDRRTSSVKDQEAAAARYAEQHGFQLRAFYGDNGITGATMDRSGVKAMLDDIRSGKVDILIIEDIDRLSRDQEHLQYMAKLFRAHGVTLHTVAIGVVDSLVLSIKGLIAEEQRRRTAYQTRRGLKGKAHRAGATGGKALGYQREVTGVDATGAEIDRYVIIEEEAAQVRWIFDRYDDGLSLKAICDLLDAEGVPTPSSKWKRRNTHGRWNPSTLSGNIERGEGILNNRAYIGERVFNRRNWVEMPNEERGFSRQPRANDESGWIVGRDESQRIIEQGQWDRVKARQLVAREARDRKFKLTSNPLSGAKRPKHLLSDLVTCGACGDLFTATGAGRWRCRNHRGGRCTNSSVTTAELEDRVLSGIKQRLLRPEMVSFFAAALQQELDAAHRTSDSDRMRIEVELAETQNRIAKLVRRIEEDEDAPRALVARLKELEGIDTQLTASLAVTPKQIVVRLPANYDVVYQRAIAELEHHLASGSGTAAREALRALVEKVVVHPGDARGGKKRDMQLYGDLFGIIDFANAAATGGGSGPNAQKPRSVWTGASVIPLVAGTGFEPVTFRL